MKFGAHGRTPTQIGLIGPGNPIRKGICWPHRFEKNGGSGAMNRISVRLVYILSSVIILLLTLGACDNGDQTSDLGDVGDIRVEKAEAIKTIVGTEEFPFPNCGGTIDLSQSLGTQTTVKKGVTIGARATTSAGGEVTVLEVVKLKLEAQVELAYQQTYETASSRLDTIDMGAAPGTHVVYEVQWEEQKFASTVSYAIRGEVYKAPYTYILRIPKLGESYQLSCPSLPSTATVISGPPTPTNTPIPEAIPLTPIPEACNILNANLEFDDISDWGIDSYRPESIDLNTSPVIQNLIEPKYEGTDQLYGLLILGFNNEFSVVLDQRDNQGIALYIDFNQNADLTDDVVIPILEVEGQGRIEPIQFDLNYGGQIEPYTLDFYYSREFNERVGAFRFTYYRHSLRVGCAQLGRQNYTIGVMDDNANGLFNELDIDTFIVDLNSDGSFRGEDNERIDPMSGPILITGRCFKVTDVSPSGDFIEFEEIPAAKVEGVVVNKNNGIPIANAQAAVFPGDLKGVSSSDGRYIVTLCPGEYNLIRTTHPDYIPDDEFEDFQILSGGVVQIDIELRPAPTVPPSGQVRLEDRDSYHFLAGERSELGGGEFYFGFGDDSVAKFWANNYPQRGLIDLGNIGALDLNEVSIPQSGYYKFGVTAVVGHTYVSLAREGEEGHYVVFRVEEIKPNASILLSFVYR